MSPARLSRQSPSSPGTDHVVLWFEQNLKVGVARDGSSRRDVSAVSLAPRDRVAAVNPIAVESGFRGDPGPRAEASPKHAYDFGRTASALEAAIGRTPVARGSKLVLFPVLPSLPRRSAALERRAALGHHEPIELATIGVSTGAVHSTRSSRGKRNRRPWVCRRR